MSTKSLAAVIIVALVVVGGAAVYFMMPHESSPQPAPSGRIMPSDDIGSVIGDWNPLCSYTVHPDGISAIGTTSSVVITRPDSGMNIITVNDGDTTYSGIFDGMGIFYSSVDGIMMKSTVVANHNYLAIYGFSVDDFMYGATVSFFCRNGVSDVYMINLDGTISVGDAVYIFSVNGNTMDVGESWSACTAYSVDTDIDGKITYTDLSSNDYSIERENGKYGITIMKYSYVSDGATVSESYVGIPSGHGSEIFMFSDDAVYFENVCYANGIITSVSDSVSEDLLSSRVLKFDETGVSPSVSYTDMNGRNYSGYYKICYNDEGVSKVGLVYQLSLDSIIEGKDVVRVSVTAHISSKEIPVSATAVCEGLVDGYYRIHIGLSLSLESYGWNNLSGDIYLNISKNLTTGSISILGTSGTEYLVIQSYKMEAVTPS